MNYKIIIADDEKKIIQLIKQLGHWDEYGIEIIDECHDGEHALKSIREKNPDFVLSDIKMPVFDGLELIQRTREFNQDILFILLSGYRHFEYARNAIQLNVMDYLLKPIDEKQLNDTLEKVCRRIDQIREQKRSHVQLSKFEIEKGENELAPFWKLLIERDTVKVKEIEMISAEKCNELYHTDFSKKCYQIICAVSNLNGMLEQNDSLFSDKVKDFINSSFKELAVVYSHATYQGQIIVLNFDEEKKSEIKKAISVLYYNIRDLNEIYGNFRLNIGCSNVKHSCNQIVDAFMEANAAEWGRLIFLGNNIIEYNQIEKLPYFMLKEFITEDELTRIADSVKFLREEELGDIFEKIYAKTSNFNNSNPESMKNVFYLLYQTIARAVKREEDIIRFRENYYYAYLEAKNFQQLIKNLYEYLIKYIMEEQKKLKEKLGKPLVEAVKFIKKNYMNPISQEDVAKAGNVSTNYLSRLFKEEIKIGFNEYLTQVRIEESKNLLSETNYTIKKIAIMVGYADEKYYSKIFKKNIGIKPTEYRRLYG